jgi:hypothetical protein
LYALSIIIVALLLSLIVVFYFENHSTISPMNIYVGIDAAYSRAEDVEELVNEVESCINFFVIGSSIITYNESQLNEVCQYFNDSGAYFAPSMHLNPEAFNQIQWIIQAKQTWGSLFWGLFPYDEAGGAQIDRTRSSLANGNISLMIVQQANNHTDAANQFVSNLSDVLTPSELTMCL